MRAPHAPRLCNTRYCQGCLLLLVGHLDILFFVVSLSPIFNCYLLFFFSCSVLGILFIFWILVFLFFFCSTCILMYSLYGLAIHSLMAQFDEQKLCILNKLQYINLSFMVHVFFSCSGNLCLFQSHENILLFYLLEPLSSSL